MGCRNKWKECKLSEFYGIEVALTSQLEGSQVAYGPNWAAVATLESEVA